MRAYHFCGDTLRDDRPIPPDGEWLQHEGPVTICETGLHASLHSFDALQYAPGPVLCLVKCEGVEESHNDKFVCRRRMIVARFDATELLRSFARQCALDVIHLWGAPDVVRQYLETGDESLRAAAEAAARAAARAAAEAAARVAAWDAARAAAWEAAWAAAEAAAEAAARAAAWAAARVAAEAAAREAAWEAAWGAARVAARVAQKARFAELVADKFREMGHA